MVTGLPVARRSNVRAISFLALLVFLTAPFLSVLIDASLIEAMVRCPLMFLPSLLFIVVVLASLCLALRSRMIRRTPRVPLNRLWNNGISGHEGIPCSPSRHARERINLGWYRQTKRGKSHTEAMKHRSRILVVSLTLSPCCYLLSLS